MNTKSLLLKPCVIYARRAFFAGSLLFCLMSSIYATSGTWTGTTGGSWNSSGNWQDGAIASGIDATAYLPYSSTAQTITLDSDVTLGSLSLAGTWSSNNTYTLDGPGKLILATSGSGKPVIDFSGTYSGTAGRSVVIKAALSGTQGFTFTNTTHNRRLVLSGEGSDLSGTVEFTGTTSVFLEKLDALGTATVQFNGTGANGLTFGYLSAITGTFQNNIVLNSNTGRVIYSIAGSQITMSGSITETGGSRNITYGAGTSVTQGGRIIVSGNNTYTGHTYLDSNVRLRLESDTALGVGTTGWVSIADTGRTTSAVELNNNVKISGRTVTINGSGADGNGTLVSISGNNEWNGWLRVANNGNLDARIGVIADKLTIGRLSSHSTYGLEKVGAGMLQINYNNTEFITYLRVKDGWVLASHNNALGTAQVLLESNGGLQVDTGIQLRISNLDFNGSSTRLGFNLNETFEATKLLVSGNQTGTGIYDVEIFDAGGLQEGTYELLTVTGTAQAQGFNLVNSKLTEFLGGSLEWNDGTLLLYVTAIPEPSIIAFLVGAISLCATIKIYRRK